MKSFLLFSLLISTALFGCKKPNDSSTTPTPTQTGQNIVVCTVNGKVQTYQGKATLAHDDGVKVTQVSNGTTVVTADNSGSKQFDQFDVIVNSLSIEVGKTYTISNETDEAYAYIIDYNYNPGLFFRTGTNDRGYIRFTRFDNQVAAGVFEFTATASNGDKKTVTQGWFDIAR